MCHPCLIPDVLPWVQVSVCIGKIMTGGVGVHRGIPLLSSPAVSHRIGILNLQLNASVHRYVVLALFWTLGAKEKTLYIFFI